MDEPESGFDRDVDRAWREFRGDLADHVATMRDGGGLVLEPLAEESGGPAGPCVQFYAWGDQQVRCEVPSNLHLSEDRHLSPEDEALLLGLGWQTPSRDPDTPEDGGSPAFWMDLPSSWADRLAEVAVRALRDVWGVPHPLFLRAESFGTVSAHEFETPAPVAEIAPKEPVRGPVHPLGEEHLRELIEDTVGERVGDTPTWDEDGDLVLRIADVLVFVGVGAGAATVDLLAPIVHSISGRTRAMEVVSDLNRQWPQLKFVLIDDRVAVVNHLPASPFVPEHLVSALDRMTQFLEVVDHDFAAHIGGLPMRGHGHDHYFESSDLEPSDLEPSDFEPSDFEDDLWEPRLEDDLPSALLELRDHHVHGRSDIAVEKVAAIGDQEASRLQLFLELSTEQHVGWTSESLNRAFAGDDDGVAAADTKALEWKLTSWSLAAALSYLEQPTDRPIRRHPHSKSSTDQPPLFDNPDEPTLFDGFGD